MLNPRSTHAKYQSCIQYIPKKKKNGNVSYIQTNRTKPPMPLTELKPVCLAWKLCVTSMTSWWALETRVRPLLWLNVSDMSWPNVYPAPLGEIPQPPRSSGSDHSKSHIGPCNEMVQNDMKLLYSRNCRCVSLPIIATVLICRQLFMFFFFFFKTSAKMYRNILKKSHHVSSLYNWYFL